MKESKLQKQIIDYCKKNRIYVVNVFGSGMCGKGTPDLILCVDGRFTAMECKVGNNKMQDDQIIHMHRIADAGGLFCCPYTLQEAIDFIEEIRGCDYGRIHHSE